MASIPEEIINCYLGRTPKSRSLTERARQVMPGGDTRTGTFYAPYPAYMVRGDSATLTDLDGNHYLDLLNNFTSLVHGHAHPALIEAAQSRLEQGPTLAAPMDAQVELAELLCERVPGVEMVRFSNSGTEATMLALRAARAYTGRSGIVKMQGSYHGTHDLAAATADPETDRGIPEGLRRDLYIVPYNDLNSVESLLAHKGDSIAAIIIEPVPYAGGLPLPKPDYLSGLRALANRYGVLLIFDEVVTLRLSEGGYQKIAGVTPDLTAMGKIIGGGFAIGSVGGKRDIMLQFDPRRKDRIPHSGTFNGHSATMAAGFAALRILDQPAIDRINSLGASLANGLNEAFEEAGIAGRTTSVGSLVQVHWRRGEIANMQDVADGVKGAGDLPYLLHLELMNRGIFAAARGEYNISTVMTTEDVDHAVTVFNEALLHLKPLVSEVNPGLILK